MKRTTQYAVPAPPTADAAKSSARGALACLSLSMLLSSLGTSIANVALPSLANAFSASFQAVQWVVLAYLLAVTTLVVGVGRLADMIGRRRVLLAGLSLFTLASVLCGAATSLWMLIVARAAQGLGAAVMMALSMALIGDTLAKEKNGSALGLLGTMSALGTALGPSLGGVLIAQFGWPAIFLINGPIGMLTGYLAYRHLPPDRQDSTAPRARFDILGSALLAGVLAAYALAMTLGHGRFGPLNLGLLLAALIGLGAFIRIEKRASSPLIRLTMFRDPVLSTGLSMNLLTMTVMMTTLVVGPFHLSHALGLAPASLGLAMSIGPLVSALTGVPAGRWVDRLGAPRMLIVGLLGMTAGSVLIALLPLRFGVPGYVIPLSLLTAGYALFQTANNTSVMKSVIPGERGSASGLLTLARNLGLISGASVMGAVYALAATTTSSMEVNGAAAPGMRITFGVAAILILVALAIALAQPASRSRASAASRPA